MCKHKDDNKMLFLRAEQGLDQVVRSLGRSLYFRKVFEYFRSIRQERTHTIYSVHRVPPRMCSFHVLVPSGCYKIFLSRFQIHTSTRTFHPETSRLCYEDIQDRHMSRNKCEWGWTHDQHCVSLDHYLTLPVDHLLQHFVNLQRHSTLTVNRLCQHFVNLQCHSTLTMNRSCQHFVNLARHWTSNIIIRIRTRVRLQKNCTNLDRHRTMVVS